MTDIEFIISKMPKEEGEKVRAIFDSCEFPVHNGYCCLTEPERLQLAFFIVWNWAKGQEWWSVFVYIMVEKWSMYARGNGTRSTHFHDPYLLDYIIDPPVFFKLLREWLEKEAE